MGKKLAIAGTVVVLIFLLFLILTYIPPAKSPEEHVSTTSASSEPQITPNTQYANPFDKDVQYVNPFGGYKNPFDK